MIPIKNRHLSQLGIPSDGKRQRPARRYIKLTYVKTFQRAAGTHTPTTAAQTDQVFALHVACARAARRRPVLAWLRHVCRLCRRQEAGYEIRHYPSQLWACTEEPVTVDPIEEESVQWNRTKLMFDRLFKYFAGENSRGKTLEKRRRGPVQSALLSCLN